MKIDWLHHTSSRQFVEHLHEIDLIREPFSDSQILAIQEQFLTNGFSYIKTTSVVKGRALIGSFLDSLHVYNDTACLTMSNLPVRESVSDLYNELQAGGYLSPFEPYCLEEFFLEHFYYDFMWIEGTRELLMSGWFEAVKRKIVDLGFDQLIPIVVIVYQHE